jgi:2'-5' RNA ligase
MSRAATARLFVAVDPPPEVGAELAAWARGVAGRSGAEPPRGTRGTLRVLEASSLHLTLCFLGGRPVGEIEALAAALGARREHVCELSVGAPVSLPPRRPRALAVEIRDRTGELLRLHEEVAGALARVSTWEPSRRRLRAHITVARTRADDRGVPALHQLPPTPQLSFTPRAVVLYRSWLAPAGATYEAVASCDLLPDAG